MKQISLIVIVLLFLMFAAIVPVSAQVPILDSSKRTVSVTGTGEVHVKPDVLIIRLGVETYDKDITVAKKQNDRIVDALRSLAKRNNINNNDFQTDYIQIQPRWQNSRRDKEFLGYFVRKTIDITIKEPEMRMFERFLSDALEAGVNHILDINFRTTTLEKYRNEARKLAVKNAQTRAESLTGDLGVTVGKPVTISESRNWMGSNWGRWGHDNDRMYQSQAYTPHQQSQEVDGLIEPGSIVVSSTVHVVFELE